MALTETPTFGERLRQQRETAGYSLADVTYELRSRLPKAMWCSLETIRRMENGRSETKANPVVVMALADLYGCKVGDLSTVVGDETERLRDLLIRSSRWISESPGQVLVLV